MRATALLSGACAAVVALSGSGSAAKVDDCPCGFVGANCSQPGFVNGAGETELVAAGGTIKNFPVADDPTATCNAANTYRCGVSGRDKDTAKCFCKPGFTGPLCDEMVDVLEYSLVLGGFLLPAFFFALSVWLVRRYDARMGNKAWSFGPQALTEGVAGKRVLLVYRGVVFLFSFSTLLNSMISAGRPDQQLQFFTFWNFILLVVLFGIGSALGARLLHRVPARAHRAEPHRARLLRHGSGRVADHLPDRARRLDGALPRHGSQRHPEGPCQLRLDRHARR
jgi:hypothetical protein